MSNLKSQFGKESKVIYHAAIAGAAAQQGDHEKAAQHLLEARAALGEEFVHKQGDPPMSDFTYIGPSESQPEHKKFLNNLYVATISPPLEFDGVPSKVIHISISRRDRSNYIPWRHKQIIKNKLVGSRNEGVELLPSRDRVIDGANQFHLWVLSDSKMAFPFGYQTSRDVMDQEESRQLVPGVHQAPFAEGEKDAL